jgi:hypothetical protein
MVIGCGAGRHLPGSHVTRKISLQAVCRRALDAGARSLNGPNAVNVAILREADRSFKNIYTNQFRRDGWRRHSGNHCTSTYSLAGTGAPSAPFTASVTVRLGGWSNRDVIQQVNRTSLIVTWSGGARPMIILGGSSAQVGSTDDEPIYDNGCSFDSTRRRGASVPASILGRLLLHRGNRTDISDF